jgi:hypothetical protein
MEHIQISPRNIYNNVATSDEFEATPTPEVEDEGIEQERLEIDVVTETLTRKGIRLLQEIGSGFYQNPSFLFLMLQAALDAYGK